MILEDLRLELDRLIGTDRAKEFHPLKSRKQGLCELRGRVCVDFTNWDVFNLNQEERVRALVRREIEVQGFISSAPRFVSGTTDAHLRLEQRLARFFALPGALLFNGRNQAFLSVISAILKEGDIVFIDELSLSPIADAAYLVGAQVESFNASDCDDLSERLSRATPNRRQIVFIETISSLQGTRADLVKLITIAKRNHADVVIDESYALGTIGVRGAGGSEIVPRQDVLAFIADLAPGLGGFGAVVAGSKTLVQYLLHRSKTFFNEAPLPIACATFLEDAIDSLELRTTARVRLGSLAHKFRHGLALLGLCSEPSNDTFLVSFSVNTKRIAEEIAEALFQRGFFCETIPSPAPRSPKTFLRFLLNIDHTDQQIDSLLSALADIISRVER